VGTVLLSNGDRLAAVPFALLGAAFVLGDAASARRSETVAVVEAAHQAERTRIARELHDVVAHQLSAIAVQAGTARLLAGSNPGPAAGRTGLDHRLRFSAPWSAWRARHSPNSATCSAHCGGNRPTTSPGGRRQPWLS